MKKRILLFIAMLMVLLPFNIKADETYESKDLKETLEAESIEADLGKYADSDEKINVYLFRGQGCSHCHEFLEFVSSIVKDYGKYFNLVSYEVWYNENNSNLLDIVANVIDGSTPEGVPYIVIGNKSFSGYTSDYDSEIKSTIKSLYNSDDKYDVMDHLDEYNPDAAEDTTVDNVSNGNAAIWVFVAVVILVVAVCKFLKKDNEEVKEASEEIKETKIEEVKEVKEAKVVEKVAKTEPKKEEKTSTKTVKKTNNKNQKKNNKSKKVSK